MRVALLTKYLSVPHSALVDLARQPSSALHLHLPDDQVHLPRSAFTPFICWSFCNLQFHARSWQCDLKSELSLSSAGSMVRRPPRAFLQRFPFHTCIFVILYTCIHVTFHTCIHLVRIWCSIGELVITSTLATPATGHSAVGKHC